MKMEDLIKYALIAGGAYVLWEYVISPMVTPTGTAATSAVPTTATTAGSNGVLQTATQPIPATSLSTNPLRAPLLALANNPNFYKSSSATDANGNATMTLDEWNYAYSVVNGHADPTNPTTVVAGYANPNEGGANYTALVSITGSGLISVDQYLNALGSTGLGRIGMAPVIKMDGRPRGSFGGRWGRQEWVN